MARSFAGAGACRGRQVSFVVKRDPPVRKDGRCVQCPRPVKISRRKDVPREFYLREPFCSAKCARDWHGVNE
jgi:hypothetical protein